MKKRSVGNVAVFMAAAFTLATSAWGDEKKAWQRDGTVKDNSGTSTEVRGIDVVEDDKRFGNLADEFGYLPWSLTIQTSSFQTFVPLTAVVTFDRKGKDLCEVTYLNQQKQNVTVTGRVDKLRIGGETDLGKFEIGMDHVAQLSFRDPPSAMSRSKIEMDKNAARSATVFVASGETVTATDFRRHARHVVSGVDNNYIPQKPWTETRNGLYRDFRFQRGESLVVVPFDKVSSITFPTKGAAKVTLKTGSDTELSIREDGENAITGFIFDAPDGIRYYPAKSVTKIVFPDAVGQGTGSPTKP